LEATKKNVAEVMAVIAVEKKDADEVREVVAKDEAEASAQESEASTLMAEAQVELNKATPLLDAAAKVLNSLEKGDFYTLGGIKAPTPAVVAGMEAACIMLGVKPKKGVPDNQKLSNDDNCYFLTAKKELLGEPAKFLLSMKNYDKENIPEKTVTAVNKIFSSGRFTLEAATSASSCLVGVYKWAEAMMGYHELLKIVNPKRAKVAEMNAKLAIVRKSLAEKRAKLKEVQYKIDKLDAEYKEKVEFEASLQAQIDEAMLKLTRANKIIEGLASEKDRWVE
jgi:dynein heavy chain